MHRHVVNTVEELRNSIRKRAVPTVIIDGDLACNILAAGILVRAKGEDHPRWIAREADINASLGPTYEVAQLMHELALQNNIEVIKEGPGPKIKVYPKPVARREGN